MSVLVPLSSKKADLSSEDGYKQVALILMKNSHYYRTLQYSYTITFGCCKCHQKQIVGTRLCAIYPDPLPYIQASAGDAQRCV